MKNTTKRIVSVLLTVMMLFSALSVSVFAEEAFAITAHPQSFTGETGDEVTMSVTATGENLSYYWLLSESVANVYFPLEYVAEDLEGQETSTIRFTANCSMNGKEILCQISSNGRFLFSDGAIMTVPHVGNGIYVYDTETHKQYCNGCAKIFAKEAHTYGTDKVCDECGYDQANPVAAEPIIKKSSSQYMSTVRGEDAKLFVMAYGRDLTYQWYYEGENTESDPVKLTDGEDFSGTTTARLTLKGLTCDRSGSYSCVVSNDAGNAIVNTYVNVIHDVGSCVGTADSHVYRCTCGEELYVETHIDDDRDGICDECEYTFAEGAPKITEDPEDAKLVNGEDATFTVTATGENLTYQWYRWDDALEESARFTGVNTATLTVNSIYNEEDEIYDCNQSDEGYYCVVSNEAGAIHSGMGWYEVEHIEPFYRSWDEFNHGYWCICGYWIGDFLHEDEDKDGVCDLCDDKMYELFDDVQDPDVWYYDAAVYGKETKIFMGSYGKFNANNQITRGELATVLARLGYGEASISGMNDAEFEEFLEELAYEFETTPVEFTDVKGKFYDRHARILAALGVINGYEDGTFGGDKAINRVELATMLSRFIDKVMEKWNLSGYGGGESLDAFADADEIPAWAKETVENVRELGLFRGDAEKKFNPFVNATRAETAQTLMRMGFNTGILMY